MGYTKHFSTKKTVQTQPIPGKVQVKNSAGGYSFKIDKWAQLRRFLILGSEGGSYYASEQKLTQDNAKSVLECIGSDGVRVVNEIVDISKAGHAVKNDPAIFALAMAASMGDAKTKAYALNVLPKVCRIGTHLFTFANAIKAFRGWGRGLRTAIGKWYTEKPVDRLAYQLCKYRNRTGWTHRDLLRKAHPKTTEKDRNALFGWTVNGAVSDDLPKLVGEFLACQAAKTGKEVIQLIAANPKIPWEFIPSELLIYPEVWEALLPNLPVTALIRNLGRMTANGLLKPMSKNISVVTAKLTDVELLRRGRVHPLNVLVALNTYHQGHGVKGKLAWNPVAQILDALDAGFYASFGSVESTGKKTLLALDLSASMTWSTVAGMAGITPRVGSAAMALVTANVEPNHHIMGFSHGLVPVCISPRMRLDDVVRTIEGTLAGVTDCSLPMIWALNNNIEVDTFVIYTDSETWCGNIHPCQALQAYRQKMGIGAKLVVVGMVSDDFTIADPSDSGMLDVVGFDLATPNLISEFSKGSLS